MDIRKIFKILNSSLAMWALFAVLMTGSLPAPIFIFSVLFIPFAAMQFKFMLKVPNIIWTILTIFMAAGCFFYGKTGATLDALMLFFIFLMGVKLVSLKKKRDYLHLYVITFFLILGAAMMTPSIFLIVILILYIFLLINTLIYFNAKNDYDRARNLACAKSFLITEEVTTKQKFPALKYVFVISFLMLLMTSMFFIFIPRFSSQVLQGFISIKVRRLSGFSDEVNFMNPGAIQSDPTVVMRVQPDLQDIGLRSIMPFYLRATSLDYYTGRKWEKSQGLAAEEYPYESNTANASEQFFSNSRRLSQKIMLEPGKQRYLFGATYPIRMRFISARAVKIDEENCSIKLQKPNESPFVYEAISFLEPDEKFDPYLPENLDKFRVDNKNIRTHRSSISSLWRTRLVNLQLPPDFNIEKYKKLGEEITKNTVTPYAKAKAVQAYFLTQFEYSLEGGNENKEDHLGNFVFVSKKGHCEYFATGMAVILRSMGIPARIATGYCTDEWNPIGRFFSVREQHAHTWVEVYMDKYGWMTIDPTPPSAIGRTRTGAAESGLLGNMYDSMKFIWYKYVLDYSTDDQRALKNVLKSKTSGITEAITGALGSLIRVIGIKTPGSHSLNMKVVVVFAVILIVFIVLLILLLKEFKVFSWRLKMPFWRRRSSKVTSIVFFKEMVYLLKKYGFEREAGETPLEFSERILQKNPNLLMLDPLINIYYKTRFNNEPIEATDLKNILNLIDELKNKLQTT